MRSCSVKSVFLYISKNVIIWACGFSGENTEAVLCFLYFLMSFNMDVNHFYEGNSVGGNETKNNQPRT